MPLLVDQDQKAVLVYYYRPDCGVCDALLPKIQDLVKERFPAIGFREVNIEASPASAAQDMVFTVPVLMLKFEGAEVFRMIRSFSLIEAEKKIIRFIEISGYS